MVTLEDVQLSMVSGSGGVQDKWHYRTQAYDDPEPNEGMKNDDEDFSESSVMAATLSGHEDSRITILIVQEVQEVQDF